MTFFEALQGKKILSLSLSVSVSLCLSLSLGKLSLFGVFLVRIFPYFDQKNSEYGHFSRSAATRSVHKIITHTLNILRKLLQGF